MRLFEVTRQFDSDLELIIGDSMHDAIRSNKCNEFNIKAVREVPAENAGVKLKAYAIYSWLSSQDCERISQFGVSAEKRFRVGEAVANELEDMCRK